jgi:hypothetical protein
MVDEHLKSVPAVPLSAEHHPGVSGPVGVHLEFELEVAVDVLGHQIAAIAKVIGVLETLEAPTLRGQPGQRGKIRTVADRGPSPCMVGTAELPGYLSS